MPIKEISQKHVMLMIHAIIDFTFLSYSLQKGSQLTHMMSQLHQVHALFCYEHFNIIPSPSSVFSKRFLVPYCWRNMFEYLCPSYVFKYLAHPNLHNPINPYRSIRTTCFNMQKPCPQIISVCFVLFSH